MHAKIMAIINVSPDSFSGDGVTEEAQIKARLEKAINEGADILDIGGQSTRPGAIIISETEEIAKIIPAIRLARTLTNKPISIDTFKPGVARVALDAGATMINDIQGGKNPEIIAVAKQYGCEIIIMHSRGTPATMSNMTDYPDGVVNEVANFLKVRSRQCIEAGIKEDKIIIDPGIGFAKTAEQNFELTRSLAELTSLGYPLLYAASRKSFLGKALANEESAQLPAEERQHATTATTVYALLHGATMVRVHDVRAAVHARRIVECIKDPSLVR